MGDESEALATRSPPPKLELAHSLDSVRVGQVVALDADGDVYTKARLRRRSIALWTFSVVVWGWVILSGGLSLWLLPYLVPGAAIAWWVHATAKPVRKAFALLAANRDAEAEALLLRQSRKLRWGLPSLRREAQRLLAMLAWRRGDRPRALTLLDALIEQTRGNQSHSRITTHWLCRCARAKLLVIMGRGEGVSLAELDGAPQGEYFMAERRDLALIIAFHAGDPASLPDDATLHDWARRVLGMSVYDTALGYLAWAFHARGDDDMAGHLHRETLDRMESIGGDRLDPRLREWLAAWTPPG
jgi:hypothetical protein